MPVEGLLPSLQLKIARALRAAFEEGDFDDALNSLDQRLEDIAAATLPYPQRVKLTVMAGYRGNWLLKLIALAREKRSGDLTLETVEFELRAVLAYVPLENVNHFQACCLNGGHIMVNRGSLRDALKRLYDRRERRIIVVTDPAQPIAAGQRVQTGKSHTRKLIAHLRQERGDFVLVEVDLEMIRDALAPPKLIMPDAVAASIVRQMGLRRALLPALPKDQQWARWALDFCDDFVGVVGPLPRTWWIVIDSFNTVLVPQETQDLIKLLAQRVSDTLGNVRMILLGYNGTFHPTVCAEEDPVTVFGEDELMEFFARAFAERQKEFTEDDVAESVLRVLDGADPAKPDFVPKAASLIIAELERR